MSSADSNTPLGAAHSSTRRSTGVQGGSPRADLAWHREMERAQAQAWFTSAATQTAHSAMAHSSTAGGVDTHHARGIPTDDPQAATRDLTVPAHCSTHCAGGASVLPAPVAPSGEPCRSAVIEGEGPQPTISTRTRCNAPLLDARAGVFDSSPLAFAPANASLPEPLLQGGRALGSASDRADTVRTQEPGRPCGITTTDWLYAPAHAPLRVSVQWQGEQANVWLGLDAGLAAQLPQIVQQLGRWLSSSGLTLAGLTCNGRPFGETRRTGPPREADSARHATPRIVP